MMKRGQIFAVTILLALFGLWGCKSDKPSPKAKAKPVAAIPSTKAAPNLDKAPKKAVAVKAGLDTKNEKEAAPPKDGDDESATGVYAAVTHNGPEGKDRPEEIPTAEDFEEEAAAKITPLNLEDEIRRASLAVIELCKTCPVPCDSCSKCPKRW